MGKRSFLIGFLLILSGFTAFSSASAATIMPNIDVEEIKIPKSYFEPGESIEGVLVFKNRESRTISGLSFLASIYSKPEELYITEYIGREEFSLKEKGKKVMSFSFPLPSCLSQGVYSLRVTPIFPYSFSFLGLGEIEIEIKEGSSCPFVTLADASITKKEEKRPATIGTVFEDGQSLGIEFKASNESSEEAVFIPIINTYERALGLKKVEEISKPEVSLKPGESIILSYDLSFQEKPQSYLTEVQLFNQDGEIISNKLFFRWISGGVSGRIIEVNADKTSYKEGDNAQISLYLAGSADLTTELEDPEVKISIYSSEGNLVGSMEEKVNLEERSYIFQVPIKEDVQDPVIKAEFSDKGKILDSQEVRLSGLTLIKGEEAEKEPFRLGIIILPFLAAAAFFILFFLLKNMRKARISALLLFILGISFLLGAPLLSRAATIEFEQHHPYYDVAITWISPQENSVFYPGQEITFQGYLDIPECLNHWEQGTYSFYISDFQQQPGLSFGLQRPSRGSEESLQQVLTTGNYVKLGDVYFGWDSPPERKELGLAYSGIFEIPEDAPRGEVYAKAHFDIMMAVGNSLHIMNIVVSEKIKIIDPPGPNSPPDTANLVSRPIDCCFHNFVKGEFEWDFIDPDGDRQSGYQVQIRDNSGNLVMDSCEDPYNTCDNSSSHKFFPVERVFEWNKDYPWRVKVWDEEGAESDWDQASFYTGNPWPWPDFKCGDGNCGEIEVNPGEIINFTNLTKHCSPACSYEWDFGDGNQSFKESPSHSYSEGGSYTVSLEASNSVGSCIASSRVKVSGGEEIFPPRWREIMPSWAGRLYAKIIGIFRE